VISVNFIQMLGTSNYIELTVLRYKKPWCARSTDVALERT
jgi:hypothetical protein